MLQPATEMVLMALVGPFALFMIALLFLMAGLLAAPSLQRKGPRRFVRDRLLRLGIPFAAFTLVLWPLLMYALYHPLGAAPGSYLEEFLSDEGYIDTGPLWFVGVLLIFSLPMRRCHIYDDGTRPASRGATGAADPDLANCCCSPQE